MNYRPNPLLYGAHEGFFSTFKLVVTMCDEVEYDCLCRAVGQAMVRYPYFSVYPEKVGESIELEFNSAPVPVFPDGRCVVLGGEESGGHLLAFGCDGRKIILHASHFIADGMGIAPLLLTVLYLYVSEKYSPEGLNTKRIPMPDDNISEGEYSYPFPDAPRLSDCEGETDGAPKSVYSLDCDAFDTEGLYAYHLRIPQRAMMGVASPSDGSPVSFLSVMLFRALCALDSSFECSVVAHVQHQYRGAIDAPASRHSLVSYIPVELSPKIKDRRIEVQNTILRGQIIIDSDRENALCAVDRLVSAMPEGEGVTLREKQSAMRSFVARSTQNKTFGISYVGKMDWCGLDRYIEDIHAYIGEKSTPNMLLIEVMTIGEDFSINFMQGGRGRRYLDSFIEELCGFGIPVRLVGEERYTLCDTKIPQ